MTREKIVARAAARRVCLVQAAKLVERLGESAPNRRAALLSRRHAPCASGSGTEYPSRLLKTPPASADCDGCCLSHLGKALRDATIAATVRRHGGMRGRTSLQAMLSVRT